MKEYKNILIIKMSSLGDIIHALPTVGAIRANWPNAKITWAVQSNFAELIPGKPLVDEIIKIDRKKMFKFGYAMNLRKELHKHKFDVVIDLQCILKSAVVQMLSGCSERYGYSDAKEGSQFICKVLKGENSNNHVIERYKDVVRQLGGIDKEIKATMLFDLDSEEKSMQQLLDKEGIGKYAVLSLGTRWENKNWPPEYYATLAEKLAQDGFDIVLTGVPSDSKKATVFMKNIHNAKVVNLIGKTNIKELFAVIKGANLFVGGDSGPMHFASLAQIPLIALYGATFPHRLGPYGNSHAYVVMSPTAPEDNGQISYKDINVMRELKPVLVISKYEEMKANGEFNDQS